MDRRHHVCGQEDSDEASTPGAGVAMIGVAMEFLVAEVNLDLIVIISFLDILEMMLKSNLIFHQQKSVLFCGGLPFFFWGRLLFGLFTSALPLLPALCPAASRGSSWLGRCRGERRIPDG